MTRSKTPGWLLPTGLILLSAVPIIAGAIRVADVASAAEVTADNARFIASPVPVLLHIVAASVFCVLGAFQFSAGFRRRRPGWHRVAGRVLVLCGLTAALSGLWMTLFYPRPAIAGQLLSGFRIVFGTAMVLSIVAAFAAVRRRDFVQHRAWMMRGYAIGQGAGTQVFTGMGWVLAVGTPSVFTWAMLMGAAWVINLLVAEWFIRKHPTASRRPRRDRAVSGDPVAMAGAGISGQ